MFFKRDPEFDVNDDFKLRIRSKLEPTSSIDTLLLDGKVYGWMVRDQQPVKILVPTKDKIDAEKCLTKLNSLVEMPVDMHVFDLGQEILSIPEALDLGKHKIVYVPNTTDFSLDELLVLYIKIRAMGVKLIYSEGDGLCELTGLTPQASKIS